MTRGFTLVETLLAAVLISLLAGVAASAMQASLQAFDHTTHQLRLDEYSAVADTLMKQQAESMSFLPTGGEIYSDPEATSTWVLSRVPCNDCPAGIGRFEFSINGAVISRFHGVAHVNLEDTH